jgi:hypothetical protein
MVLANDRQRTKSSTGTRFNEVRTSPGNQAALTRRAAQFTFASQHR